MRCFTLKVATLTTASLTIVLATAVSAWAQNVGGRQNGLNIAAMAQQIFTQSDRNHNNLLSRTEFSTAQLLTDNTVVSLGRAGLIGRGRPFFQAQLAAAPRLQGGMLGQQGGLPGAQITNTNRVTQPQFTNYFQNAVARGDALWRQLYASNRRTNGRAYPRYGRGYGYSPYRNYGYGSYRPSVMTDRATQTTTSTPAQHHLSAGPGSTGGTNATGTTSGLPSGVTVVPEGAAATLAAPLEHEHHAKHNKTGSATGTTAGKHATSAAKIPNSMGRNAKAGTASPFKASARNQNARTLVTAMAQSRAAARRAYSAGGGGNALSGYGGGGHGGGSAAHVGRGGGGHAGGGHGGGGHGGGHHR